MHSHYIVLDLETAADLTALPLLDEPGPAGNLKDPAKIEASIRERKAAQLDRMSLDPFAGRIVCVGFQTEQMDEPRAVEAPGDDYERTAIELIATRIGQSEVTRHIIGQNVTFDLAWLMTRARLLSVPFPQIELRRYNTTAYTDLMHVLTCNGLAPDGAMRRTLHRLCQRFGIPVEDDTSGADIATLVAADDWAGIAAHCRSDVALTHALAVRLGVVEVRVPAAL